MVPVVTAAREILFRRLSVTSIVSSSNINAAARQLSMNRNKQISKTIKRSKDKPKQLYNQDLFGIAPGGNEVLVSCVFKVVPVAFRSLYVL